MGRLGRYLEGIACFDRTGRLALYGKFEGAFEDVSGFDSRMRVPRHGHAGLDRCFYKQSHIARHRPVCL